LANSPLLTDKAFPSPFQKDQSSDLTPLILRHSADSLRVIDLSQCKITDDAVEGIVSHAPRIQTFILSGCSLLTDKALESISKLRDRLDVLMLAHVCNITDRGIINLARACNNLRCIDVACEWFLSTFLPFISAFSRNKLTL
jgi:F-box and leucine-rich repeat protein GRR1